MIVVNGVSYLTMVETAKRLGMSTSTFYAMYKAPVIGPPRTKIGKYFYISVPDMDSYQLKSRCVCCRAVIPYGDKYCCPECKAKYLAAKRERLIGSRRNPSNTYEIGPKKKFDAVCPVCKKSHFIFRSVKPSCKWIYCEEHEYRRYWYDPDSRRRSAI